jgi:fimbrial chaperone protein
MRLPSCRDCIGLGIIGLSLIFISPKSLSQSQETKGSAHFSVIPVQIFINGAAPSPNTFLKINNTSDVTKRFQAQVFSWTQTDKEPIQLTPSQEIVLFPLLLTIEAGKSRDLRVGIVAPPKPVEKTYRILIQELPDAQTQEKPKGTGISFLIKMSVPVFVTPEQPQSQPGITNLANNKGKFSFQLSNTGNAHYMAKDMQVTGTDASGKTLFQKSRTGWYVLAGSTPLYDLELPKTDCQKVTTLTVNLKTDTTNVSQSLPTPKGICP